MTVNVLLLVFAIAFVVSVGTAVWAARGIARQRRAARNDLHPSFRRPRIG